MNNFWGKLKVQVFFLSMPDRTSIFFGWSVNLSNFLSLWVEAGASPMYPQKMRVPPLGLYTHFIYEHNTSFRFGLVLLDR